MWKTFLKNYGVMFFPIYLAAFALLVTFYGKFKFPTFPGDLLWQPYGFTIYFPFASSFAIAIFCVVMFHAYKIFKNA